jgi:hypothetical protein
MPFASRKLSLEIMPVSKTQDFGRLPYLTGLDLAIMLILKMRVLPKT